MEIRLMPIAGGDDLPVSIEVEQDARFGTKNVTFWQAETSVWFTLSLIDLRRALNASAKYPKEQP